MTATLRVTTIHDLVVLIHETSAGDEMFEMRVEAAGVLVRQLEAAI